MGDEDRWEKVRRIVGEENEKLFTRLVEKLGKKTRTRKSPVEIVNGQWTGITPELLSSWKTAYGSVDIDAEMKKAAAWLLSNPTQAPNKDLRRYLNNWLAKHQERSAIRSIPTRNEPLPMLKTCSYCERPSTCAPNRIPACDDHSLDAMDQKPVKAA